LKQIFVIFNADGVNACYQKLTFKKLKNDLPSSTLIQGGGEKVN
jgi:hypothetical protein